jgi:hypothetical protein
LSTLFTRPQFRDRIRRKLQIVPPSDSGTGNPGDQPLNQPYPTNSQINDALQDAIADVNRECGFHVLQFTVPVAATQSGSFGPFALYLGDLTPHTTVATVVAPTALINDVRRVLWNDLLGDPPILLTPDNRNALDRGETNNYFSNVPGTPETWYVEGYTVFITPAHSISGAYTLTCNTGVIGLQCETDVLDQCPIDFQVIFEYQAIVRLMKASTLDAEAAERAQNFLPDAQQGIIRFKSWVEGLSGTPQPQLAFKSYRRGYGTMRTRR